MHTKSFLPELPSELFRRWQHFHAWSRSNIPLKAGLQSLSSIELTTSTMCFLLLNCKLSSLSSFSNGAAWALLVALEIILAAILCTVSNFRRFATDAESRMRLEYSKWDLIIAQYATRRSSFGRYGAALERSPNNPWHLFTTVSMWGPKVRCWSKTTPSSFTLLSGLMLFPCIKSSVSIGYTSCLEIGKKQHFICSNLTVIHSSLLSFFFLFFLFFLSFLSFFFFLGGGGGMTPSPTQMTPLYVAHLWLLCTIIWVKGLVCHARLGIRTRVWFEFRGTYARQTKPGPSGLLCTRARGARRTEASFEWGWGSFPPPGKRKKERKRQKKEKKEKKERKKGTMNNVKLLHIKCCFFPIFQ